MLDTWLLLRKSTIKVATKIAVTLSVVHWKRLDFINWPSSWLSPFPTSLALVGWACTLLFPCTWTRWAWTICSVVRLPENWICASSRGEPFLPLPHVVFEKKYESGPLDMITKHAKAWAVKKSIFHAPWRPCCSWPWETTQILGLKTFSITGLSRGTNFPEITEEK